MSKLISSLKRLQAIHGFDDETFESGVKNVVGVRSKRYLDTVNKKYGTKLVQRAWEWITDNLSPSEIQEMSAEGWVIRYMQENPKKCSSDEIARALGRDGFKKLLHNPIEDEVDPDRWEEKEGGELREHPPQKKKLPPPSMPPRGKLKGMDSNQLKKLIDEARAAGVGENDL